MEPKDLDQGARSVAEIRRDLVLVLAAAGFQDAQREARRLVEAVTGLSPEQLLRDADDLVTADEQRHLANALSRRLKHEPLSRIAGEREFFGRSFRITPAVLDPRPETETLIEVVLAWVDRTGGRERPLRILDVGTGSGAILITLLAELPRASGIGTDIMRNALDVASENARTLSVADRAHFEQARSLSGIDGVFDVLVSNPPYISSEDIAHLEPAVRDFDPLAALDGGPDGLTVYRDIVARAGELVPNGLIAFEVGEGQAEAVSQLLEKSVKNGCGKPWVQADLGGHERTVALLTHC